MIPKRLQELIKQAEQSKEARELLWTVYKLHT
jgi:hypothetical protein